MMSQPRAELAQKSLTRVDWLIALMLSLGSLACYWRTAAPDLLFGDSGEFQVLAVTGGLAHTTGYPIYLVLAKLFTLLPFGNVAFAVNVMSGVFAGLAVGLCFLIGRILGVRKLFSLLGSMALAIQPLFWWQASIAEVYTTSTAALGAIVFLVLQWRESRSPLTIFSAGLLGGICLGLHHLVILTLPAVLLSLVMARAKWPDWRMALAGVGTGVCLAFVAYVVMGGYEHKTTVTNALKPSASAYGMEPDDFDETASRIRFILLAKQWEGVLLSEDRKESEVASKYIDAVRDGFRIIPSAFAAIGFLSLLASRRMWAAGVLIVGSWLAMVAFIFTYRTFDIQVFFVPTLLMVAIGFGFALQMIQGLVGRLLPLRGDPRAIVPGLLGLAVFASMWPTLSSSLEAMKQEKLTFLTGAARQIPFPTDQPMLPRRIAEEVDSKIEDNALVLHSWQILYPAYHVSHLEKGRGNIEYVETMPTGTNGKLAASMHAFIDDQFQKRPVYIGRPLRELADRYDFIPLPGEAVLFRLVRK